MSDQEMTREQLIAELETMRQQVSKYKQAEEQLREQREWFKVTLSSIGDGVIATDTMGNVSFMNHVAEELTGYNQSEAFGKPINQIFNIINETTRLPTEIPITRVLSSGVVVGLANHTILISRNWREIPIADAAAPILNRENEVIGVVLVFHDISERKQAEERLRESEEKFKSIFEQSPIGIELYNAYGYLLHINKACMDIFGVSESALAEVQEFNLFQNPNISEEIKGKLRAGQPVRYEAGFDFGIVKLMGLYRTCKQGKCYLDSLVTPIRTEEGTIVGYLVQVQDITHRKLAVNKLQESEERYRQLVEMSPDAVFVHAEGIIYFANAAAVNLLNLSGREELIGMTVSEFFNRFVHPDYRQLIRERNRMMTDLGQAAPLLEEKYVRADGSIVEVEAAGSPFSWDGKPAVQVVARGISDRKKLEEELIKSDKLESIGILAGGIAHDFNNVLTVIAGNSSLAKLYLQTDRAVQTIQKLDEIEKAIQQAKKLTQQLLTFAKGGAPVKQAVTIGDLVKETIQFALSGSNVVCDCAIADGLLLVEADVGQISQVINNLVINAVQAMPDGGKLRVKIENVHLDYESGTPAKTGDYIKIVFADEGIGIPQKYLPKIFDPYFTTKQKGSGLGLATSYAIIRKHDGWIEVDSEVGVGTTFRLYLPAASVQILLTKQDEEKPFFGRGKILIMDDEKNIREIAREMLISLGYEVQVAKHGQEALEMYQQALASSNPFDGVIMDLTIPGGMGGKEAIKQIRAIHPEVKAIVASGYSNNQVLAEYILHGFNGYITKPFKLQELSRVVSTVILS